MALVAGLTLPHPSAAEPPTEQQVKTSFIVRFLQFVEWPPAAFATPAEPITIVALGEDPLVAELEQVAATERVNGRALVVRRVRSLEDLRSDQVLLVGRSEAVRLPAILPALRDTSVLTIGDFEGFADRGGIIGFFMENDRVRFEINAESAGAGCGATFTLEIAPDVGQETNERCAAVPGHSGSEAAAPKATTCAPSQGQTGTRRS